MNGEPLKCARCGREVRVVRLGRATLALGHTQNPKNERHMVQLARSAADRDSSLLGMGAAREDSRPQSEEPNMRRGAKAPHGRRVDAPSPRTTQARSRSGRSSAAPSPSPSRSRVDSAPSPRRVSAAARSAGALQGTAGER